MSVQFKRSGGVIASLLAVLLLLGAAFVATPAAQAAEKAVKATVAVSNDGTTVSFTISGVHFVDTDGVKKNIAYSVMFAAGGKTVFNEGVYSHGEVAQDTFKVPQGTKNVSLRLNQEGNDFDSVKDLNGKYGLKWSTSSPSTSPSASATPSASPTATATSEPTSTPTGEPTGEPTSTPTAEPTSEPSGQPTSEPTGEPSEEPTAQPTGSATPSASPTGPSVGPGPVVPPTTKPSTSSAPVTSAPTISEPTQSASAPTKTAQPVKATESGRGNLPRCSSLSPEQQRLNEPCTGVEDDTMTARLAVGIGLLGLSAIAALYAFARRERGALS